MASIELDFLVQGDGSLGPLQKPEASKVMWDGKKRRCCPETVRLKLNRDGGSSGPSRMEGTMVFKKVPTRGTVTFSFGSSGYTGLKLKLGPSAGAWGALALPFASAIYRRRSAVFVEDSDRESEESDDSQPPEQKAKALKAEELKTLSSLIKSYWDGKGSENQTAPVFKFDLDESVFVERCLLGDLHLISPESAKVGQLASVVKRFDLVAMKTSGEKGQFVEPLVLKSLNLETFVCKVVSERESFKDPIDKEPSRLGHVTLSNLRFLRRPTDYC